MRALFIPDDAGQGHIVRCAALGRELRRRNWRTFTIGPREEVPNRMFQAAIIDTRQPLSPIPGIPHTVRIVDEVEQMGPCDLLVMGHAGPPEGLPPGSKLGPEYAMLRREFVEERGIPRTRKGVFDARKLAGWSAEALAEEMASAAIVITYGGMRALEAACLGTPTVLVARNHGERMNVDGLANAGCGLVAHEETAQSVADDLIGLTDVLEKMRRAAMQLVDGGGCQRVAYAIEEMLR